MEDERIIQLLLEVDAYFQITGHYRANMLKEIGPIEKLQEIVRIIQTRNKQGCHVAFLLQCAYLDSAKIITSTDLDGHVIDMQQRSMIEIKGQLTNPEILEGIHQRVAKEIEQEKQGKGSLEQRIQKKPKRRTTTARKINYTAIRQKALRYLRDNQNQNPFKKQHDEYFRKLINGQQEQMQATEKKQDAETQPIFPPQTQHDARFAYQIHILLLNACAPKQWPDFENECRRITEEYLQILKNGYNPEKLLQYFGPEMAILRIIPKDRLPKELSTLVDKLLPANL